MILVWLTFIPLAAGVLGWILSLRDNRWSRWIPLVSLLGELFVLLALWAGYLGHAASEKEVAWLAEFYRDWIPQLNIGFHLAMDGLSLLMVTLTVLLGLASVICSWTEIQERVGFFHFNLMALLTGIIGVFLAVDLILFYFFWEIMLVPMYLLIGIWGHENRIYAAIKFFIFTQAGGLAMLAAIIGLYYVHGAGTGTYTFDYFELLGTSMAPTMSLAIMLGFFIAFAVKLPAVPLHVWLADAHTEAPTAGSVILAGLLLKTGGYGLIRFVVPLFPDAAREFAPVAMILGVVGILYGAILAFAQEDFKRLVAYSSVSHLGFVLLGVFALNHLALQGAVVQMISHGITTGALFILVGMLQERIHTRDMNRMGGLWSTVPIMGGITLVFALASLGIPGLGNFVGEFLVLIGTYQADPRMAVPAAAGLVLAAVYCLWMIRRVFSGPKREDWKIPDLSVRELVLTGTMVALIVSLGLYPQPVLSTAAPALKKLESPSQAIITVHAAADKSWTTVSGRPVAHSTDDRRQNQ